MHSENSQDEKIGGADGMRKFVHMKESKDLNVGVALDEGMASPTDEFALFYGERCIWHIIIHYPGQSGHGSLLLENTAGEKVAYLLNKFNEFRNQEIKKLKDNPTFTIGDVTTVNLTQMSGRVQSNAIPPEFTIIIDCRIPLKTVDGKKWEENSSEEIARIIMIQTDNIGGHF